MTRTERALIGMLAQAVNTFLAGIRAGYRVTAEDVRLTRRDGWLFIALPMERLTRR